MVQKILKFMTECQAATATDINPSQVPEMQQHKPRNLALPQQSRKVCFFFCLILLCNVEGKKKKEMCDAMLNL